MDRDDWPRIMTRLCVGPIAELNTSPPAKPAARLRGEAEPGDSPVPPPSPVLWSTATQSKGEGEARFGVRKTTPGTDIQAQAARLVAVAIERGISPIILSHVARSGFEALGFRVERIHGETEAERAAQEAELCTFWDLSIVIDAEDIAQLS